MSSMPRLCSLSCTATLALILCGSLKADQKKDFSLELVASMSEYIQHVNKETLPAVKRAMRRANQTPRLDKLLQRLRLDVEHSLRLIVDMQRASPTTKSAEHEMTLLRKMLHAADDSIKTLTISNKEVENRLQRELVAKNELESELKLAKLGLQALKIEKDEITQISLVTDKRLEQTLTRLAQLKQDNERITAVYDDCRASSEFRQYQDLKKSHQIATIKLTQTTNELKETADAASNCLSEFMPADDRLALALQQIEKLEQELFEAREASLSSTDGK